MDEALRRRLPLTICHAWHWPYPVGHVDHEGASILKRTGENLLHHGAGIAGRLAPTVPLRQCLKDGPAASALLHEAADAEVVVVGSHEQADLPVGSSALQIPARAHRPVVVVRDARGSTDGRVVVGVDGSAASDAALGFAFEEAALQDWRLEAVYGCWEPSAVADSEIALFADKSELERTRRDRLYCAVAPWREKYPQVQAQTSLVLADPRTALLNAAKGADLTVMGARGARGLHPQLLGATTLAMLQLAPCSVAVTHASHTD